MFVDDPRASRVWSNNPNAPKIPYFLYLGEKATFAGTLIGSVLYGIVVVLFFKCVAAPPDPVYIRREAIKWGLVSYTVAMFSFVTVFTTMNFDVQSTSFIDNREFGLLDPQPADIVYGPLMYQTKTCPKVFGFIPSLMFLLNYWLADGLLLYRCYIIYGMNLWVMVLPGLMYLSTIATGAMLLAPSATEEYGCVLWIASLPAIDVPHYSLSISLNILLTLMIVIRLALHTRNIRTGMGVPGVGGLYKTIITMLVESSVIYATSSLLVLGWLGTGDGFGSDFLPILAETQVIAPLLIILRVANKTALTSEAIVPGRISTFKARTRGESAGGGGTLPGVDPMSSVDEYRTNSGELRVGVETTIESRPDEI